MASGRATLSPSSAHISLVTLKGGAAAAVARSHTQSPSTASTPGQLDPAVRSPIVVTARSPAGVADGAGAAPTVVESNAGGGEQAAAAAAANAAQHAHKSTVSAAPGTPTPHSVVTQLIVDADAGSRPRTVAGGAPSADALPAAATAASTSTGSFTTAAAATSMMSPGFNAAPTDASVGSMTSPLSGDAMWAAPAEASPGRGRPPLAHAPVVALADTLTEGGGGGGGSSTAPSSARSTPRVSGVHTLGGATRSRAASSRVVSSPAAAASSPPGSTAASRVASPVLATRPAGPRMVSISLAHVDGGIGAPSGSIAARARTPSSSPALSPSAPRDSPVMHARTGSFARGAHMPSPPFVSNMDLDMEAPASTAHIQGGERDLMPARRRSSASLHAGEAAGAAFLDRMPPSTRAGGTVGVSAPNSMSALSLGPLPVLLSATALPPSSPNLANLLTADVDLSSIAAATAAERAISMPGSRMDASPSAAGAGLLYDAGGAEGGVAGGSGAHAGGSGAGVAGAHSTRVSMITSSRALYAAAAVDIDTNVPEVNGYVAGNVQGRHEFRKTTVLPDTGLIRPMAAPGSPVDLALQAQVPQRKKRPHLKPNALKRLQQGDEEYERRKKAKELGKVINRAHAQYQTSFGMMLGIYTSVVQTHTGSEKLMLDDFMAVRKLVFPREGSALTVPHNICNSFKFKDYAPTAFHHLRKRFYIDQHQYLASLGGAYEYIEFNSNSKSGSFFFYSHDGKFMIKTQSPAESKFLRRILAHYYQHVMTNPHTYLTRFYGMHRIKMPHLRRKVHFVVMQSVFYGDNEIHEMYDLKGSTVGRAATEKEKARGPAHCVFKDLDMIARNARINLGAERRAAFLRQIQADAEFLARMRIMDYSLLLGIHHKSQRNTALPHALVHSPGPASHPALGEEGGGFASTTRRSPLALQGGAGDEAALASVVLEEVDATEDDAIGMQADVTAPAVAASAAAAPGSVAPPVSDFGSMGDGAADERTQSITAGCVTSVLPPVVAVGHATGASGSSSVSATSSAARSGGGGLSTMRVYESAIVPPHQAFFASPMSSADFVSSVGTSVPVLSPPAHEQPSSLGEGSARRAGGGATAQLVDEAVQVGGVSDASPRSYNGSIGGAMARDEEAVHAGAGVATERPSLAHDWHHADSCDVDADSVVSGGDALHHAYEAADASGATSFSPAHMHMHGPSGGGVMSPNWPARAVAAGAGVPVYPTLVGAGGGTYGHAASAPLVAQYRGGGVTGIAAPVGAVRATEPPQPDPAAGMGIEGMDASGQPADEIYYFGIIDILQQYNLRKMSEMAARSVYQPHARISSVGPNLYAKRFTAFLAEHSA